MISFASHSSSRVEAQAHSPVRMAFETALPTIWKPKDIDPRRLATFEAVTGHGQAGGGVGELLVVRERRP